MIQAVIFDMDGVLIDSQPIHYEIDRMALEEQGVLVEIKELEEYAGTTTKDRFRLLKERYGIKEDADSLAQRRETLMKEYMESQTAESIPGVRELIEGIKKKGLKVSVASATGMDMIMIILKKIGLLEYFDDILSGESVRRCKPAPDVFLESARRLGTDAENCVVIEDSGNGVLAANRAEMKVIGFLNPNSGQQDLSTATVIIQNFREIDADFILNL